MAPNDQLSDIIPRLSDLVDGIDDTQLDARTPCEEFAVRDVLQHMVTGGVTFAHLFRGETPPEPPSVKDDDRVPSARFRAAMDDLLDAVRSQGAMERTLSTPFGEMDGATFARLVAVDGAVHAWDLAVASEQPYLIDPAIVAQVETFARATLGDDVRGGGVFDWPTEAPSDASTIERLAAFTGRIVDPWRTPSHALHVDKDALPAKIDVPGAQARQVTGFGNVAGYSVIAGEYFSMAAGTDIAPLLAGLDHDTCHAPHWGYMLQGEVVVSFVDGTESTCSAGEIFYWPPGHSVSVTRDADVILFSPQSEHVAVLDHMLDKMSAG